MRLLFVERVDKVEAKRLYRMASCPAGRFFEAFSPKVRLSKAHAHKPSPLGQHPVVAKCSRNEIVPVNHGNSRADSGKDAL